MDTEGLKVQYFKQQVDRGIREIFQAQAQVAAARVKHTGHAQGGTLMAALTSPRYSVTQNGGGVEAHASLPVYARFIDMKRKGNYRIYNKQVWGILYRDVRARIRYEFEDFLEQQKKNLQQSINK